MLITSGYAQTKRKKAVSTNPIIVRGINMDLTVEQFTTVCPSVYSDFKERTPNEYGVRSGISIDEITSGQIYKNKNYQEVTRKYLVFLENDVKARADNVERLKLLLEQGLIGTKELNRAQMDLAKAQSLFAEQRKTIDAKEHENNIDITGINSIGLEFLDDSIDRLDILYSSDIDVNSAAEFAAKVSTALKLPDTWKFSVDYSSGEPLYSARMTYGNFLITLYSSQYLHSLSIWNVNLFNEIDRRTKAETKAKLIPFKP